MQIKEFSHHLPFVSTRCISEEIYQKTMLNEVEPFLKTNSQCGYLKNKADQTIYYEYYSAKNNLSATTDHNKSSSPEKGCIVISHGFSESCQKYHEFIYYLVQEGYSVGILDHRGFGNSLREVDNPSLIHVGSYHQYIDNLHAFITKVIKKKTANLPLYLYAHSMGGAIAALYLQKYPDTFQKVILNAPMFSINLNGLPFFIVKLWAKIALALKQDKKKVPIHHFFRPEPFEGCCTNSKQRYHYYLDKRIKNTKLQTCAATYSWLNASIHAINSISSHSFCRNIHLPILLFQAEKDSCVLPRGQIHFLKSIKQGTLIRVPDSKHEIYLCKNTILEPYLEEIFTFLR